MLRRSAAVLAAVVLLPLLPTPGAQAGTDGTVRQLQSDVDRTAQQLTEATRRLERSESALTTVQRRLAQARREVEDATHTSEQARGRLGTVLAATYRTPIPDTLVLALSGSPERFRAAVVAQADLTRVRGGQQELVRRATAQRVRAQSAARTVEQLAAEADRRGRDLSAQLVEVRSSADAAAARLSTASARLVSARLAAGRATCTSTASDGANGFLDPGALCPLDGAPGAALRADAADAFDRLTAAAARDLGGRLCVTDSYRTYAGQVSVFRRKPRLAAVPGTSRHGLGLAVDLGCGVERFGSRGYRWMKANGPRYGWYHPAWAEPRGATPEPWHWEYRG